MKLRTRYILFVVILHGIALLLSYFIFSESKAIFIASEAVILFSIFLSWRLYNDLLQPLELLLRGKEAIRDRDFNVKFVLTGKYEMDELISVYNQMIDELRSERIKQERQQFFLAKLINTSPTGILILDFDEKVQQLNPKALELLDIKEQEILGKSLDSFTHPVIQQIKQLDSGHTKIFIFKGTLTYKLQKSHFIDRGFPRHFVMIEELTEEILAAEKNAYGKVIRMMAHEVNNTIGPVNSIIQTALQSSQHNEELRNALEAAMERNDNLNLFMRNFADLVRIPLPNRKPLNLLELVQKVTDLMYVKAREKNVGFVFEHEVNSLSITGDLQQMEQVLINIIKNAIEAIDDGGTITIVTQDSPKQIIIRDTGNGMSPEFEEQLFTPFFSTKKDGQGLGLTLIKEILTNHGYHFTLKTLKPGQTEFSIQF
jgi:two-component system, NtrC family, nitrogen regulation sensor histidine kinase NtrY